MPRLFSGLEIPDEIASELALVRGGLSGARWIEPDDYHITLRFFGDVDARTANALCEEMAAIFAAALTLSVDELAVFGGARPRALIARVKPSLSLSVLQTEHERLARRLGLAPETRKFSPHVTLARLRDVSPLAAAGYLASRALTPRPFVAPRFVLYSSRDSVGGGPYLVEAAFPFG